MARGPVSRSGDGYRLRLDPEERGALRHLVDELREVLEVENPASDPAVARLFPPAYPEDPLQNLEYEHGAGAGLLSDRLAQVRTMQDTLDADQLSEEELLAWLGVLNGLRLVLGVRLNVTEETTERDFPDEERRGLYGLYVFLTWLVERIVAVLPVH